MLKKLFTICFIFCFAICSKSQTKPGTGHWQTDAQTGVRYIMLKHNNKGNKASMGDVAFVQLLMISSKDSILRDSHKNNRDSTGSIPVMLKHSFVGCLEDGIALMSAGDSARFSINTDSLYLKRFNKQQLPPYEIPGAHDTFNVKLVRFMTEDQLKEERMAKMKKMQEEREKSRLDEPAKIAKYLKDHNITVKPTEDSLFFISRSGGSGETIKNGDSVEVAYTGYLLDGTIFDKSDHGPGNMTFKLAYGPNADVIASWIKTLGTMRVGEKVKMLTPSKMAYGNRQASQLITPYCPLIFDIEVIRVWK
jgi:FKBP-type peptidyl-prolyl cis-trans isomerase